MTWVLRERDEWNETHDEAALGNNRHHQCEFERCIVRDSPSEQFNTEWGFHINTVMSHPPTLYGQFNNFKYD